MSFRSLESAICAELRNVLNNRSIRVKDILEWSTGDVKGEEGEIVVCIPNYLVNVCVKKELDKRK